MNVFSSLQVFAGKWKLKESRSFNSDEITSVEKAEVMSSKFGNSVCFFMKSGGQTYIPLDNTSNLTVGDTVDLSKAELVTLCKDGENDIFRVKI